MTIRLIALNASLAACVVSAQAAEQTPTASRKLVSPAAAYVGPEAAAPHPIPRAADQPAALPPRPLSAGRPSAARLRDQAELQQKLAERDRLQREIDELRHATQTAQQIVVNVQVLEVHRTALRELGIDFAHVADGGVVSTTAAELLADGQMHVLPGGAAEFFAALARHGIVRTLAEPTLVTVSGRPASFFVGGEMPMPAPPGSGRTMETREFGTRLDVLAEALGDNKVRLQIHPRLSEIDESHSIEINGQRVPALKVRELSTACEISIGETLVLNGLVQQRTEVRETEAGRTNKTIDIGLAFVVTTQAAPSLTPAARTASAK